MKAQISFTDKMIIDNFAGGGGASTGIELALGRPVDIAINHDPDAILMHKTNHPYTKHLCESVWDVDPAKLCAGRKVALAWFSPDCTHHSKARGGKPAKKNIRGLTWVTLRWAMEVRPQVIMLENVEEIQTWGPLTRNEKGEEYPDPARKCETFRGFIKMLSTGITPGHPAFIEACEFLNISTDSEKAKMLVKGLRYKVDYRELKSCDYGAPTIRKRFYLGARCDGRPFVWPEPTHGPGKIPYRTAAEIIDWKLPCPSIFDKSEQIKEKYGLKTIRPLAGNTMQRIARGTDKFVIQNPDPYIVPWTVSNVTNATGHKIDKPIDTIKTGGDGGQMLITPIMTAIGQTGFSDDRSYGPVEPVRTIVSKSEECVIAPMLIQYHGAKSAGETRGQEVDKPLYTVDSANRYGIAAAFLTKYFGHDTGQILSEPLHTVTSKDREAVAAAFMSQFHGCGTRQNLYEPSRTILQEEQEGLAAAFMSKYYAGGYTGSGNSPDAPLNTITSLDYNTLALAHIVKFKGDNIGQPVGRPLQTVTAGGGQFGEVRTFITKYYPDSDLHHWPEIRKMLNEYCGYTLTDDEILLFEIRGCLWFLSDIGLRMLTPRELYSAQGAPPDYIIDHDYTGKHYPKPKQVARCGNMVTPPVAEALVRVNFPELACRRKLVTMAQLEKELKKKSQFEEFIGENNEECTEISGK